MSESPQATSESAGEGVAVTGARVSCGRIHARSTDLYERIGWGGCGEVVSGCHGVVLLTQSHMYRIGPGGCGEVVSGCHGVVTVTAVPSAYASESVGEGVAKWCPEVVTSSRYPRCVRTSRRRPSTALETSTWEFGVVAPTSKRVFRSEPTARTRMLFVSRVVRRRPRSRLPSVAPSWFSSGVVGGRGCVLPG